MNDFPKKRSVKDLKFGMSLKMTHHDSHGSFYCFPILTVDSLVYLSIGSLDSQIFASPGGPFQIRFKNVRENLGKKKRYWSLKVFMFLYWWCNKKIICRRYILKLWIKWAYFQPFFSFRWALPLKSYKCLLYKYFKIKSLLSETQYL